LPITVGRLVIEQKQVKAEVITILG
jgi:hypothetical protein